MHEGSAECTTPVQMDRGKSTRPRGEESELVLLVRTAWHPSDLIHADTALNHKISCEQLI